MTVTETTEAEVRAGAIDTEELLAEVGGAPQLWRWLATPVLLVAALVLLWIYLQNQDLDRIEEVTLNWPFVREKIVEHVQLTFVSTFFVILIAVPLGIMLTRPATRRLSPPIIAVANVGQAVPSIGVLVLLAITVGIGFRMAVIALVAYATLPVLRNTMVGLEQVDDALIESGRGMGLSAFGVLKRIELPLAVPVMLAGIRTALVINVGTATLATFVGAGGLGFIIDQGTRFSRTPVLITGSVLTAVLALFLDWLAGIVEEVLKPRGL